MAKAAVGVTLFEAINCIMFQGETIGHYSGRRSINRRCRTDVLLAALDCLYDYYDENDETRHN